jgi:hypothetical protein
MIILTGDAILCPTHLRGWQAARRMIPTAPFEAA